jgi:hypothetical protein
MVRIEVNKGEYFTNGAIIEPKEVTIAQGDIRWVWHVVRLAGDVFNNEGDRVDAVPQYAGSRERLVGKVLEEKADDFS